MAIAPLRFQRTQSNSVPIELDTILSGPCSRVPVTVTPLTDDPSGPRIVSSPASGLVVGIAPINEMKVLAVYPHFAAEGGYACLSHGTVEVPGLQLRPGETLDLPRRIREHRVFPPCVIEHVLLVGSADHAFSPLDKGDVLAIQWLLYSLAERAGRATLFGETPPRPPILHRRPQVLARWSADLRPLLTAAGTLAFVPPGDVIGPMVVQPQEGAFQAVKRGYETTLPPGLTEAESARSYELAWGAVTARATTVSDWTIIHAGSTADPVDRPGIQPCIAAKRQHLQERGVLQQASPGLLRFTCDTAVPSLTNALRILTGTNEPRGHWRLVP
jgi:hypothetical protein